MADPRSVSRRIGLGAAFIAGLIVLALVVLLAVLYYQARRPPTGGSEYVSLGSSYAAGSGLGPLVAGTPVVCMRAEGSYPRRVAHLLGISLTDMSCSGATAEHVLIGGQYFQRPQISAVTSRTRLVTLTVGGNDLHYVGDLMGLAKAKEGGIVGWAVPRFLGSPHAEGKRDGERLHDHVSAIIHAVRARSPTARILVITYPAILPRSGTCTALGLTAEEADRMRTVEAMLGEATRSAARETRAALVDMAMPEKAHGACSPKPWVNGAIGQAGDGDPFHPTRRGAEAIARAVARQILSVSPPVPMPHDPGLPKQVAPNRPGHLETPIA